MTAFSFLDELFLKYLSAKCVPFIDGVRIFFKILDYADRKALPSLCQMMFKMSDDVEPFFHGSMAQLTFRQRTKTPDPSSEYATRSHAVFYTTVPTGHAHFYSETSSILKQRVNNLKKKPVTRRGRKRSSFFTFMTSIRALIHSPSTPISPGLPPSLFSSISLYFSPPFSVQRSSTCSKTVRSH